MKYATKSLALIVGLAALGGSTGIAAASTPWQRSHPWRVEVNHRLANLNRRIDIERREHEIGAGQAAALHREVDTVRREERFMARFNRSHLTPAEHRALNQEENGISRRIGR